MSRRWLSLWLPQWPIERMRLAAARRAEPFPEPGRPLALLAPEAGGPRLTAVDAAARRHGLRPGQRLADARAVLPSLILRPAEPVRDAKALEALALWCGRWSPWTAPDGADGITLDLTGCAHLFGGERRLLADLLARLDRLGLTARAAVAHRHAAAWAWARFGRAGILPAAGAAAELAALPVRALRLDEATAQGLDRLGLRRIGQLVEIPRTALLARFGGEPVARLEAMFGEGAEPWAPLRVPVPFTARIGWPEPIGRTEDIAAATRLLLEDVAAALERAQEGARLFRLSLWRLDGEARHLAVATGRPVRAPEHVLRLFALQWDGLDLGFGVELVLLEALDTSPLAARQPGLALGGEGTGIATLDEAALDRLVDRLTARLGHARVLRPEPVQSHVPERAQRLVPAASLPGAGAWLAAQPRPLRLLLRPEPIEALARLPDSPPVRIVWRDEARRIRAAAGPERILPEWWQPADDGRRPRDFYRLTDADGRTLWVCREGCYGDAVPPAWGVAGLFD